MARSKTLKDTGLWKAYAKMKPDAENVSWIEKVYQYSVNDLKAVRDTFPNYTLHDETHVLNVIDSMSGLLRGYYKQLTQEEIEVLILVACLHDIGMVYTEEERQIYYAEEKLCYDYTLKKYPIYVGLAAQEWSAEARQGYLRTLHPFRVMEVLQRQEWQNIFSQMPASILPQEYIVRICQSHGEDIDVLRSSLWDYNRAYNVDLRFCAMLLRLADILDFDDTRAPEVLYRYAKKDSISKEEWDKHITSGGFTYPRSASQNALPYRATCKNPMLERVIHRFLDWVDEELKNCQNILPYCDNKWQKEFPLPVCVDRRGILANGYVSGDFSLTMNQSQILNLFTGENLYDNNSVFLRELLQNAVDATLLRGVMDPKFVVEDARIDLWEWTDENGVLWFRIDDQGTGMTQGMLQKYFLKVGNSYYSSEELKQDLKNAGKEGLYHSISRFGIGFLSCFLCGEEAIISTTYFSDEKSKKENENMGVGLLPHSGLRMNVTGLQGYYILKSQQKNHLAKNLPAPKTGNASARIRELESNGYRKSAGTSIAIRLNADKLGTVNLKEQVEGHLCGTRMPVYYNGSRIGVTYNEIMCEARKSKGKITYEMTNAGKKHFDRCFPELKGKYPLLLINTTIFGEQTGLNLSDFQGVAQEYDLCQRDDWRWVVKDQPYTLLTYKTAFDLGKGFTLRKNSMQLAYLKWDDLEDLYGKDELQELDTALQLLQTFPGDDITLPPQAQRIWTNEGAEDVWKAWVDHQLILAEEDFALNEWAIPEKEGLPKSVDSEDIKIAYQGIVINSKLVNSHYVQGLFLLEGACYPEVNLARTEIRSLPPKYALYMHILSIKLSLLWDDDQDGDFISNSLKSLTQAEWRLLRKSDIGMWMEKEYQSWWKHLMQDLERPIRPESRYDGFYELKDKNPVNNFGKSIFQESYTMMVDFQNGQQIAFLPSTGELKYDSFPTMMFCNAANSESKQYLCAADPKKRKCINADHPFALWLLKNKSMLFERYPRNLRQLLTILKEKSSLEIIKTCKDFSRQLRKDHTFEVAMEDYPSLSKEDFWECR